MITITTATDRMAPTAWHQTTPPPWDRGPRLARIEAIRAVSFAHQIERDWDEIAREAVEGNHQRTNVRREFKGK